MSDALLSSYVRVCPSCGAESAAEVMRCVCGALLTGVDLQAQGQGNALPVPRPVPAPTPLPLGRTGPQGGAGERICPHQDCGQPNPAGSVRCRYCDRSLEPAGDVAAAAGLLRLPAVLAARHRVIRPFPSTGAEAELLLLEPSAGGPPVVAKIYRGGLIPKAGVRQRLQGLESRYRVETLESGVADGHYFELMEYCAGGSLKDLARNGPLPLGTLHAVAAQVAAALAAVHAAGLVHRDLKPDNILLRSREPLRLVLADFGIASVLDATQRFTGTARTLHYGAPEGLSGIVDAKTDYWALGILLLEMALGRHPFAGLSDAVILHHLATRRVDASGVEDAGLRKLLRGLLLRDPALRWGGTEVDRWLAHDSSQAEPAEPDLAGFQAPYRLGGELCQNQQQLATAFARHWREAVSDLGNGQLLAWFRDVQKDQDTVRLLLGMRQERALHVDVQLLRLMLHLAPGIPPVWRGEGIELRAVLSRADQALKGDESAELWLDALHQHRVLEAYAAAGNAELAEIARRWDEACQGFEQAWTSLRALLSNARRHETADYDELVYGDGGASKPSLLPLHARLLAAAFDPRWLERLRLRLSEELVRLRVACPWMEHLGAPAQMPAAQCLALEALMPEARAAMQKQRESEQQQALNALRERDAMQSRMAGALADLLRCCEVRGFSIVRSEALLAAVEAFQGELARMRGEPQLWSTTLAVRARRVEPSARRLQALLFGVAQSRAINEGWMSSRVSSAVLGVVVMGFLGGGAWLGGAALAGAGGLLAWRLLPPYFVRRDIRAVVLKMRVTLRSAPPGASEHAITESSRP